MTRGLVKVITSSLAILALFVTPAFAYSESVLTTTNPSGTPAYSCPDCHSLEAGVTSPTVAPRSVPSSWTYDSEAGEDLGTRKGPHGGYTSGTQKCGVCHTIHGASLTGGQLLAEETIAATCYTCHDGTGGGGVYGVIQQRMDLDGTPFDPAETSATAINGTAGGVHRIGFLNSGNMVTVPGGNADGSSLDTTFTGSNGSMTCTDCHSPHNSNTVKPFIGDRSRSVDDTTTTILTNRLLRKRPTLATVAVTEYGSNWCESCHVGSHPDTATAYAHPVSHDGDLLDGDSLNYSHVSKLTTYSADTTTTGPLGGDNFGYFIQVRERDISEPEYLTDPLDATQPEGPICQQCHEDSRDLGAATGDQEERRLQPSQAFSNPTDGQTAGNPRFQNFPHEAVQDGLLVENKDDLCLNCHP